MEVVDDHKKLTVRGCVHARAEVLYFMFHVPYALSDLVAAHRGYKLQPHKVNDAGVYGRCLRQLLVNHVLIQLPLILVSHPIFRALGIRTETAGLPSWGTVAVSCVVFLVVEDFYFYWIHRLLHWGPLYPRVHKVHHHHTAPLGIAAEYAHPIETLFLGLGTMLGPFLLADHLFTVPPSPFPVRACHLTRRRVAGVVLAGGAPLPDGGGARGLRLPVVPEPLDPLLGRCVCVHSLDVRRVALAVPHAARLHHHLARQVRRTMTGTTSCSTGTTPPRSPCGTACLAPT